MLSQITRRVASATSRTVSRASRKPNVVARSVLASEARKAAPVANIGVARL
jgi:hypothetical protein